MACAKTCVLLCLCCCCHSCCCCCKDYTELFYLLTARSVYTYNFCMSYSMRTCPCVRKRVLHMVRSLYLSRLAVSLSLSLSLLTEAVQSLRPSRPSVVAVCVLLFCARLHVQISTTISSSMAMKVASFLLLLTVYLCLPHSHHRLFRSVCMQSTEIETCNKWPCLTFCSGRTVRIAPIPFPSREHFTSLAVALQFVHFNGS